MFILIWPANLPAYVYVAEYMVLDYICCKAGGS
jgi:hypothetical protein